MELEAKKQINLYTLVELEWRRTYHICTKGRFYPGLNLKFQTVFKNMKMQNGIQAALGFYCFA